MAVGILWICTCYTAIGALFGFVFVWLGVQRVDSAARGARLWVRLLILPGVIALWPALALRWRRTVRTRERT